MKPIARLPGTQRLNLAITLPLRNQKELQILLHDLYDPASPSYRHFLTVEEFTERFGPTTEDHERVASFARTNGLTVTHTAQNRLVLDVSGKVADIERVFHVKMQVYQHPTEPRTFYSPDGEPSLDASLPVQGISGLTNFSPPHPASLHPLVAGTGTITSEAGSGPGGQMLGSDVRAAYAPAVTLDGTGQAIGLFEEGGYNLSDIQLYFSTVSQPLNVLIVNVLLDGISGTCGTGCDDSEEALDIDAAISMAPNLSTLLVYEGNTPVDILNQMATDNIAKQLSASYVWDQEPSSDDPIFEEFAAQGQNFFASSGDGGAFSPPDCTSNCFTTRYPSGDPYVTGVGGTELTTSGPGGSWQSETSWPDSGGGINSYGVAIPSYQIPLINSLNQGSTTLRNIPDVAAQAAGIYICANGECFTEGGTSLSAPLWAGFLALANQHANGTPIGFLNPTIYLIAQSAYYGDDFHDITSGNNFDSYSPALFSAVPGYDLVTGLGSPNGQDLISALAQAQTGPNFALVSTPGTLSVVQGSQMTSSITIQALSGFSGTVNLSAAVLGQPTGVTATLNQSSIAGAAASTLTVSTTSSTSVPSMLIAVTGTSGGLTQTVYINVTVLLPDLVETAVSAPPASVIAGAGFSVTDTVQNTGQAPAGASVTRYYLSPTTNKTSSSILLVGSRAVPALAVGATSTGTVNVTVPVSIWPSTPFYLLACANDTGTVAGASSGICTTSTATTAIMNPPQLATTTTLEITSAGSPVTSATSGSVVTLTAAVVSNSAPVLTGQVNFCDASAALCTDINLLGTAQLTSKGTATLKYVPSIGTHSYKAIFAGTISAVAINATSTSAIVTLNVNGIYPTTTTIGQSGSVGDYTLSATVTAIGGSVAPSGMVSFLDTSSGNTVLGTAELSAGTPEMNWYESLPSMAILQPFYIAIGDFNGDGKPDLAMTGISYCAAKIFLGNGDGTFTEASNPAINCFPEAIAIGDFNGDGIADLAISADSSTNTTVGSGSVNIFLGNGDGTFSPVPVSPATGLTPESMVVGDFNGDGRADLAIANLLSNTVTVLLGNGDGTFTAAASIITGDQPQSLAAADFNGDGKIDLAIGYRSSSPISVLLGNGDGTFTAAASVNIGGNPCSLVTADFNADGKPDLAAANCSDNTVAVLLGNGDGTFNATSVSPDTGNYPISMAVGDFNGDGKADLAIANLESNTTTILLGNGDGTFISAANSPAAGSSPYFVAAGNFNGGGSADLALADFENSTVTVHLSELTQTVTLNGISPVGTGTHQVDASYPGDTNYSSSVSGTIGLTAVTKTTPTMLVMPTPASITTTQALSVAITVSGGNGNPTPTGTVTLSSGGYTSASTVISSGSATITVPAGSLIAGTDTLTIVYTPDTASFSTYNVATGTGSVSVAKTTPTVTVTPSASSITTAQSLSVTIAIAGTPTPTGTVTLSTGSYTSAATTLSSGSATINIPAGLLAVGSDTLTANYTPDSNSSLTYNSASGTNSVTVNLPPSFTLLPSASPLSVVQSGSNTDTVTVSGANGFTGSVTLSASGLPSGVTASFGTNPATGSSLLTLTAASTATVGGPTTVTITGISGSLTESTTIALTVTAAPSFTLVPAASTLAVVQGSSNTDTITVNPANGFTGSVALAASGLPSGVTASFGTNPATGSSVLTLTATSSATVGGPVTVTITGTSGSLTETTTVALTVSAAPTFVVGGGSSSLSIEPGATTGNTVPITVTPSNGFTGTVNLTCSVTPVAASDTPTCTLTPNSVTITGTAAQSSTLTISTTAATSAKYQLKNLLWPSAGTALALLLFGIPRRKRNWLAMFGVLALVASLGVIGCGGGGGNSGGGGGGGSGGGGGGGGNAGTTPGTYTVTLMGTSGTVTGTEGTVTLTVQ